MGGLYVTLAGVNSLAFVKLVVEDIF